MSKEFFPQFASPAPKVQYWKCCRTVVAISPKIFRSNPKTDEELKWNSHNKSFSSKRLLTRRVRNLAEKNSAKNGAESIKIQKDKKNFPIFKKYFTCKRSLDTQLQFRQLWLSFPARSQEVFQLKSGNGRTILIFCKKEASSNRSSGYVEWRIEKTEKKFSGKFENSRSKSLSWKKTVSNKKRTFFVQNVSVNTYIAIFSKLWKNCHKAFKQDLLQTRIWEKINKFP